MQKILQPYFALDLIHANKDGSFVPTSKEQALGKNRIK